MRDVAGGDCLKLTTYFSERDRVGGQLLADALLDVYGGAGIETGILLRGIEGFGLKHHLSTDRLLSLSQDPPIVSVAVDAGERIEAILGEVTAIGGRGLVTLERARMSGGRTTESAHLEAVQGRAKLTVYLGRQERVGGAPAFVAVCDLLHRNGISGATALLGVDGTVRGERRRGRFFSRNAEVPMMVIAIGEEERIGRILPELGALLRRPLITLERVQVCKRDGELLARPRALPGSDGNGMGLWQKLTVYTSEAARHGGRPIHVELIRRLRQAGAIGATSLRGVWGFHGDHAPHGDTRFGLRRRVPAVTIVVDAAERIAAAFEIVDGLTAERGLVTAETVPAMAAASGEARRGGLRLAKYRV